MTISAHLTIHESEMVNTLLARGRKSEASAVARVFVAPQDGSGWQKLGCGVVCFVRDSTAKGYFLCAFDINEQKEILKEEIYSKFFYQRPQDLFMIFEGENEVLGLNFYEKREADLLIGRIDQLVFQRRQRKGTAVAKPNPPGVRVGVADENSNRYHQVVEMHREQEPVKQQMGNEDKNATNKKISVSGFFGSLKGKRDRINTSSSSEIATRPEISGPLTFQHVSSGASVNKQGVQILKQPQIIEGKTEDEKENVAVAILRLISNDQSAENMIDYRDEKLLKQIRSILDTHATTDLEEFKKLLGLSEPATLVSGPVHGSGKPTPRTGTVTVSVGNASSIRVKPRPPQGPSAPTHQAIRPSVPPPKPPIKTPNQQPRRPPGVESTPAPQRPGVPPPPGPPPPGPPPPGPPPPGPPPPGPPPPGPPPPVAPPPPSFPGVPPPPKPPAESGSNGPSAAPTGEDDARANVMTAIRNAGGIGRLKKAEDRPEPEKPKPQSSGDARDDLLAAIRQASKNNLKKIEVDSEKEEKRREDFKSQQVQEKFVGLIDQLQVFRSKMHADSDEEEDEDDEFDDFDGED